jgi:hypothetical protein
MEKYQKILRNGQKKSAAAGKLLEKAGKSWKKLENSGKPPNDIWS